MGRPLVRPVWGLWITTALWLLVTGGMWALHDHQLKHGEEIHLKTVPVDPRDPLRGDYVILRYEISTVESGPEGLARRFRRNQTVFVELADPAGEWIVKDIHNQRPEEGLSLRGRVLSASDQRLEIVYGIESFFVREGEGKRYEEARNRDRLWAVVSVSPHGVAHLQRLEIR